MLKEITIESYKSLKNVTVQFKDGLNIIIGKNGSRKSNLLEFVMTFISPYPFFSSSSSSRVGKRYSDYDFRFLVSQQGERGIFETSVKAVREVQISEGKNIYYKTLATISSKYIEEKAPFFEHTYNYNVPGELKDRDQYNDIRAQMHKIKLLIAKTFIKYNVPINLNWLDKQFSFEIDSGFVITRNLDNEDLTVMWRFEQGFENYMIIQQPNYFADSSFEKIKQDISGKFIEYLDEHNIVQNLKKFSPIGGLRINKNINVYKVNEEIILENLVIEFYVNDIWVPWSYLSDGTKRLFYTITEMSCEGDNGLILVDEPELGIHPHQLYKLMQFIKEQSETKQIIISTHSPLVLDTLQSNELDRIIIAKNENGSSKFEKLSEEQMKDIKKYVEEVNELSYYWIHSDLEEND